MPGIFPVIGDTREEAEHNYEALQELIVPEVGLELLSSYLGDLDLSNYDLKHLLKILNYKKATIFKVV